MRDFVVRVLSEVYRLSAYDRYHAASQGVRLYLKDHPSSKYNFTTLMTFVSARLEHPEIPGRKTVMYD